MYILRKILGMTHVVMCKYINCTVDKTTGAGTGYTTHVRLNLDTCCVRYPHAVPCLNFYDNSHQSKTLQFLGV